MPRNRVLAIIVSIVVVAAAYVLWQRADPPKPMGTPINGAGSASPMNKPNLGKVEH